jgi:hypothetical protein
MHGSARIRPVDAALRSSGILAAAATAAAVSAGHAGATPAVAQCNAVQGYVVYANGLTCPTAKTIVKKLLAMPYRSVKVTIRSMPAYVCVATYGKRTRTMKAGSCLKLGTQATGFGWTKNGATVPLPPGVDPGAGGATGSGG